MIQYDPDQLDDSLVGDEDTDGSRSGYQRDSDGDRPDIPESGRAESTLVEDAYNLDILDEIVLCTNTGEVVEERDSDDPEMRVDLVDFVAIKASQLGHELGLGKFSRMEIEGRDYRAAARVAQSMNGFARVQSSRIESEVVGNMLAQAMNDAGGVGQ